MKILNFLLRMVFGAVGINSQRDTDFPEYFHICRPESPTLLTVGSLGTAGSGCFTGLQPLEFCEKFTIDRKNRKRYNADMIDQVTF